jgi:hypothetical protein
MWHGLFETREELKERYTSLTTELRQNGHYDICNPQVYKLINNVHRKWGVEHRLFQGGKLDYMLVNMRTFDSNGKDIPVVCLSQGKFITVDESLTRVPQELLNMK